MALHVRFPDLPRIAVAVMTAALVLIVGSTYAAAQSSEPVSTGPLTAPPASTQDLDPGDELRISGAGFAPGSTIDITMESTPVFLKRVTADATGAFSTTVQIPAGADAGSHTVKATGPDPAGGIRVLSVGITVDASANDTLVRTGSGTTMLAVVGVVAIAGGSAILAVRRRRA